MWEKVKKVVDPERVKALRRQVRLSQSQFAEKLAVDVGTVSRWERGQSKPSQVHLRQITQLWGFSLERVVREDRE